MHPPNFRRFNKWPMVAEIGICNVGNPHRFGFTYQITRHILALPTDNFTLRLTYEDYVLPSAPSHSNRVWYSSCVNQGVILLQDSTELFQFPAP